MEEVSKVALYGNIIDVPIKRITNAYVRKAERFTSGAIRVAKVLVKIFKRHSFR